MIKVTLVRPEGCVHCAQVKETLAKLKKDYLELEVLDIDMLTPKGQEVAQKYGIMASPGIIINGKLAFQGGATEEQLRGKFREL